MTNIPALPPLGPERRPSHSRACVRRKVLFDANAFHAREHPSSVRRLPLPVLISKTACSLPPIFSVALRLGGPVCNERRSASTMKRTSPS